MVLEERLHVCRNCGSYCPVVVTLDGKAVVKVEGDFEAPLYRGYTCPKGRMIPQQHHNPNRLLHSLKKLPDGRRVPISSEQLVEEIADRLSRIIDESGPQAVQGVRVLLTTQWRTQLPISNNYCLRLGSGSVGRKNRATVTWFQLVSGG